MSAPDNAVSTERRLIAVILVVALLSALGAWLAVRSYARQKGELPEDHLLDVYGLNRPITNRLDAHYVDADADMVADLPTDPAQRLAPQTLKFNYLAAEQEHYEKIWAPFLADISQRVGRPVEYQRFDSPEDQLRALKKGETHIVGLNSGAVPIAVDVCGFRPLYSFGAEKGLATYTMQIIVRKDRPIDDMKAVAGHMIAFTDRTSNSGWKAPLMVLWHEFHLQPVHDFDVVYSGNHAKSIHGIATGKYQVAAVASDELARAVDRGDITPDAYAVLYESEPFCNNTFGVPYNLDPEIASAVKAAFDKFSWDGTELKEEFSTIGADRFTPVNYKADFKLIREIDDSMGRRHEVADAPAETPADEPAEAAAPEA